MPLLPEDERRARRAVGRERVEQLDGADERELVERRRWRDRVLFLEARDFEVRERLQRALVALPIEVREGQELPARVDEDREDFVLRALVERERLGRRIAFDRGEVIPKTRGRGGTLFAPERAENGDELGVRGLAPEAFVARREIDRAARAHDAAGPLIRLVDRRVGGGVDRERVNEDEAARDVAMLAQRFDEAHQLFARSIR